MLPAPPWPTRDRGATGRDVYVCVLLGGSASVGQLTTQDTGPRGAFCSRGVWGLPGCLSVRPAVKIHSFIPEAETVLLLVLRLDDLILIESARAVSAPSSIDRVRVR